MSKYPIKDVLVVPVEAPAPENRPIDQTRWYENRAILKVTATVEGKDIDVITTHFGLTPCEKIRMEQELSHIIDTRKNPCILMGDFNLTPDEKELDPYYARLKSAAVAMGKKHEHTFATMQPYLTLDYFFLSDEFKILDYKVVDCHISDHFPIQMVVSV